jgi:hypothetical protein
MEEETANLLGRIAGMRGQDIAELSLEWLKPLAEQEFERCARELAKEADAMRKKK